MRLSVRCGPQPGVPVKVGMVDAPRRTLSIAIVALVLTVAR